MFMCKTWEELGQQPWRQWIALTCACWLNSTTNGWRLFTYSLYTYTWEINEKFKVRNASLSHLPRFDGQKTLRFESIKTHRLLKNVNLYQYMFKNCFSRLLQQKQRNSTTSFQNLWIVTHHCCMQLIGFCTKLSHKSKPNGIISRDVSKDRSIDVTINIKP